MHRIRLLRVIIVLCMAAIAGGCALMSKNPVGAESAAVKEEGLWGNWIWEADNGDVSILHILPHKGSEGKVLDIVFAGGKDEDGGWYALKGHASAVGESGRYLNLQLIATDPAMMKEVEKSYPDRAEYSYAYVPYKLIDAEHVQIGVIPAELVRDAIKQGALEGKVSEESSFFVAKVSDTSEKIAAYLATQKEETIFRDAMLFTRVHPPK
jgi:hypothetical protein